MDKGGNERTASVENGSCFSFSYDSRREVKRCQNAPLLLLHDDCFWWCLHDFCVPLLRTKILKMT